MSVRSFIDTNILVYADVGDEPAKQETALTLLATHLRAGTGVISTQVLQEFVNVALRKLALPVELIRARLALYNRFELVVASASAVNAALDLHVLHRVSFWDALIVHSARESGCVNLLTEDMSNGSVISGVRVVNPFVQEKPLPGRTAK
jgi:predicted nucleic acid-binding protein